MTQDLGNRNYKKEFASSFNAYSELDRYKNAKPVKNLTYEEFMCQHLSDYLQNLRKYRYGILKAVKKLHIELPQLKIKKLKSSRITIKPKIKMGKEAIQYLNLDQSIEKSMLKDKYRKRSNKKDVTIKKTWLLLDLNKFRQNTRSKSVSGTETTQNTYNLIKRFNKGKLGPWMISRKSPYKITPIDFSRTQNCFSSNIKGRNPIISFPDKITNFQTFNK